MRFQPMHSKSPVWTDSRRAACWPSRSTRPPRRRPQCRQARRPSRTGPTARRRRFPARPTPWRTRRRAGRRRRTRAPPGRRRRASGGTAGTGSPARLRPQSAPTPTATRNRPAGRADRCGGIGDSWRRRRRSRPRAGQRARAARRRARSRPARPRRRVVTHFRALSLSSPRRTCGCTTRRPARPDPNARPPSGRRGQTRLRCGHAPTRSCRKSTGPA